MDGNKQNNLIEQAYACLDNGDLANSAVLFEQACQTDPADPEAWMMLGVIRGETGNIADALACLQRSVRLSPDYAEAQFSLGNLLRMTGDVDSSLEHLQRAVALDPSYAEAWMLMGVIHGMRGEVEQGEACCRQAALLLPDSLEAQMSLANVLWQAGKTEEALSNYQTVVALQPGMMQAWDMLARGYLQLRDFQRAENCVRSLLEFDPRSTDAWCMLGEACIAQGRPCDAIDAYRQAAGLQPGSAQLHYFLAHALTRCGEFEVAVKSYETATRFDPNHAAAYLGLGFTLHACGRHEESVAALRKALEIGQATAEIFSHLSNAYRSLGDLDQAEDCLRQALKLEQDHAEVHNKLGNVLRSQGRVKEAIASYRRAIECQPGFAPFHSNLLMSLNYLPEFTPEMLLEEHRQWAGLYEFTKLPAQTHPHSRDSERRLRIGYVSPDFRTHAVAHFIEPLLRNHDRSQFEIFCYAEVHKPDATTVRLQEKVQRWCNTSGMDDVQMVNAIREDGIDILVDLAGHTANNRLTAIAARVAPIQVSYLGYPNTTGLSSMDYRLTDEVADPPGSEVHYSERLMYLADGFSCYQPQLDAPDVSPLPARSRGHVTFGSFSNLFKINEQVIDLWCRVLNANSSAHLLIYRHVLRGTAKERYYRAFEERGIKRDRVTLASDTPGGMRQFLAGKGYMHLFEEVDIILDTLPWNNHTISCETLWMGLPVVTLAGDRHAGRICASVLHSIGLDDLIAHTPDEFVRIATVLASNLDVLEQMRWGLRRRMQDSTLCDSVAFAAKVETAYREMWRKWCATGN